MLVIKNDRDEMIENLSKYVTKTHVTLSRYLMKDRQS
jgi:hypothetical protein